eukprot:299699-Rhodomonas_salina.1
MSAAICASHRTESAQRRAGHVRARPGQFRASQGDQDGEWGHGGRGWERTLGSGRLFLVRRVRARERMSTRLKMRQRKVTIGNATPNMATNPNWYTLSLYRSITASTSVRASAHAGTRAHSLAHVSEHVSSNT